jgi:hypothetical protein
MTRSSSFCLPWALNIVLYKRENEKSSWQLYKKRILKNIYGSLVSRAKFLPRPHPGFQSELGKSRHANETMLFSHGYIGLVRINRFLSNKYRRISGSRVSLPGWKWVYIPRPAGPMCAVTSIDFCCLLARKRELFPLERIQISGAKRSPWWVPTDSIDNKQSWSPHSSLESAT